MLNTMTDFSKGRQEKEIKDIKNEKEEEKLLQIK